MDNAIKVPFEYSDLLEPQETRTYAMDFANKRIIGHIDGKEAVMQSIRKILSTRRFVHLIYNDQYGFDAMNRINVGLTDQYLDSDIPQMTEEALMADDRITGIGNFIYEAAGDAIHIEFTAYTIYGDVEMKGVIQDGKFEY